MEKHVDEPVNKRMIITCLDITDAPFFMTECRWVPNQGTRSTLGSTFSRVMTEVWHAKARAEA